MFQVQSILIFWSLKMWLSFVILLRFSQTCEFWSSKASWRLRFSLPSIILTDLLGNKTLLLITGSKGHGFWFVIGGFRSVLCVSVGAFHLGKNPEISAGAKVEFPSGKKLFHLVVSPGTSRCRRETRNVNGTQHSIRKFQPGKRAHLFRFSTFSGNFPVGWTDETCSIYRRTGNSGNFD